MLTLRARGWTGRVPFHTANISDSGCYSNIPGKAQTPGADNADCLVLSAVTQPLANNFSIVFASNHTIPDPVSSNAIPSPSSVAALGHYRDLRPHFWAGAHKATGCPI